MNSSSVYPLFDDSKLIEERIYAQIKELEIYKKEVERLVNIPKADRPKCWESAQDISEKIYTVLTDCGKNLYKLKDRKTCTDKFSKIVREFFYISLKDATKTLMFFNLFKSLIILVQMNGIDIEIDRIIP